MPYTNIVTLHHNSERVGFVYILFYYYKQQRWRPIPLNKNQTYDEHITRTHCRKGTPSPLGQFSHLQSREERVSHPWLHQRSWQYLLQGNTPL